MIAEIKEIGTKLIFTGATRFGLCTRRPLHSKFHEKPNNANDQTERLALKQALALVGRGIFYGHYFDQ